MNGEMELVPCSTCRLDMLAWRGVFICGICDQPPLEEASWFRRWRTEPFPGTEC